MCAPSRACTSSSPRTCAEQRGPCSSRGGWSGHGHSPAAAWASWSATPHACLWHSWRTCVPTAEPMRAATCDLEIWLLCVIRVALPVAGWTPCPVSTCVCPWELEEEGP